MTHESQHKDALAEHVPASGRAGASSEHEAPADGQTADGQAAEHATTPGQTGGLPGANADPRTRRVGDDETAPTTAMGEVAEQ
jgi:hypothetical protein